LAPHRPSDERVRRPGACRLPQGRNQATLRRFHRRARLERNRAIPLQHPRIVPPAHRPAIRPRHLSARPQERGPIRPFLRRPAHPAASPIRPEQRQVADRGAHALKARRSGRPRSACARRLKGSARDAERSHGRQAERLSRTALISIGRSPVFSKQDFLRCCAGIEKQSFRPAKGRQPSGCVQMRAGRLRRTCRNTTFNCNTLGLLTRLFRPGSSG